MALILGNYCCEVFRIVLQKTERKSSDHECRMTQRFSHLHALPSSTPPQMLQYSKNQKKKSLFTRPHPDCTCILTYRMSTVHVSVCSFLGEDVSGLVFIGRVLLRSLHSLKWANVLFDTRLVCKLSAALVRARPSNGNDGPPVGRSIASLYEEEQNLQAIRRS